MAGWLLIPDWGVISITIALMSLFITVLLQMVAKAFSLQSLNMWVRAEYAQVAVSFLIIFFALAMLTAGNQVAGDITYDVTRASGNIPLNQAAANNLRDPSRIGQAYLDKLTACESTMYYTIFTLNFFTEFFSGMKLNSLGVEDIGGGYAFTGAVSLYHYLANNLVYLALFNYIQYYVLQFSQYVMLPIFLPIGLILRAFPITRGAGGLITSIALGFAFVYPISYVLIVAMMPNAGAICSQIDLTKAEVQATHSDPCLNNRGAQAEKYYQLKSESGRAHGIATFFEESLNIFFLQSLIYPFVVLIMTFTFIRQTSSLFGADLAEIGRGLMKII